MKQSTLLARALRALMIVSSFALFAFPLVVYGQTAGPDPLSGKFEGQVKSGPRIDSRLTLEIISVRGKLSGRFVTPQGASEISGGSFSKGKLRLKLGRGKTATKINALLLNDTLTGEWIDGKTKRPIELLRVPPVVVAAVAPAPAPAPVTPAAPVTAPAPTVAGVTETAVTLAGDWDAIADAQGQGLPFTLSLRVDGDKVTGESNSSLGAGTISGGSWRDGKLVFQLDTPSGPVAMSAVMKDGGLVGEFDYAGQIQGRWVAKKRTP